MSICKNIKKIIISVFMAVAILVTTVFSVSAEDSNREYSFELSLENVSGEVSVNKGDSFDVVLTLTRTDDPESYLMYALHSIVRFDSEVLKLDSYETHTNVDCYLSELKGRDSGKHELVLNYLAKVFTGDRWDNSTGVLTMHFTALEEGECDIIIRRGQVSTYSGMDNFKTSLKDLKVIVGPEAENPDDDPDKEDHQDGWYKNSDGTWYYYRNGVMATGWLRENGLWYYLRDNGSMATGWEKVDGIWYYMWDNGVMATGWVKSGDNWYYMWKNGSMATGWVKYNEKWYYMEPGNGKMITGWYKVKDIYYYSYKDGHMAESEWIDGWWLSAGGAWTYKYKGGWKQNAKGWWFEDDAGWYPVNMTIKINGTEQEFDSTGYWVEK